MIDKAHLDATKRANLLAVNLVARRFLPPGWQDPSSPHLLNLAAWGIEKGLHYGMESQQGAPVDQLEYRAAVLAERPWARVAAAIPVTAEELEERESPEDAAVLVLSRMYHEIPG